MRTNQRIYKTTYLLWFHSCKVRESYEHTRENLTSTKKANMTTYLLVVGSVSGSVSPPIQMFLKR